MQATALICVSHGIEALPVHVHTANTRAMGEFRFNMVDRCSFLTDKCAVVSFRRFVKSFTKYNRRHFFVVVAAVDVVFSPQFDDYFNSGNCVRLSGKTLAKWRKMWSKSPVYTQTLTRFLTRRRGGGGLSFSLKLQIWLPQFKLPPPFRIGTSHGHCKDFAVYRKVIVSFGNAYQM